MPYEVNEVKQYANPPKAAFQAVLGAVEGLQGTVLSQDANQGHVEAKFNKTIHGKVLGDRTQISVQISAPAAGGSSIAVEAYPIDPVGRKLQFGARKGVTQTVVGWFFAHVEHRLK